MFQVMSKEKVIVTVLSLENDLFAFQCFIFFLPFAGFESSSARDLLVGTLSDCGFKFQEFLISPTHLGIPNSRLRYYLIARKGSEFGFQTKPDIWTSLDDLGKEHFPQRRKDGPESCLESYLEPESSFSREEYELEDKLLLKVCFDFFFKFHVDQFFFSPGKNMVKKYYFMTKI